VGAALVLAALGAFALLQLNRVNAAGSEIAESWLPSVRLLGTIEARTSEFRLAQLAHNLTTSAAEMGPFEREMDIARQEATQALDEYEPLLVLPEERRRFEAVKRGWTAYLDDHERTFLPLSQRNENEAAAAHLKGPAQQLFANLSENLDPWWTSTPPPPGRRARAARPSPPRASG
jgi:methyl-accepting chemotaxis protein